MRFHHSLVILAAFGWVAPPIVAHSPVHSVATVNDARSHGVLRDGKLSLVEGLLLNMRVITENDLSMEERAQLGGFGTDIAWLDIDASVVPVLTFERDLPVILDTPHGLAIGGSNGRPVIDISGTTGFVATSDFLDLRNLEIRGGTTAVTMLQRDTTYGTVLENVTFSGQSSAAVRFAMLQDAGLGRFQVTNCEFDNIPTAIDVDSGTVGRDDLIIVEDTRIRGGQVGLNVRVGTGGTLRVVLDRNQVDGASTAFAIRRTDAGSDRAVTLEATHNRTANVVNGFHFAGHATGAATILMRQADFSATQQSLFIGPLGADTGVLIEDSRLAGKVDIAGGGTQPVLLANSRLQGVDFDLGSAGAPVRVTDSILDSSTFRAIGTAPVGFDASRFVSGTVSGIAAAPVTIRDSFMGGVGGLANVTVQTPLAAAQLGSMEVAPLDPQIGTNVVWSVDLPPSLAGVWLLGPTARWPAIGPQPFHLYFESFLHVALPNVMRGQSQISVPVPSDTGLIGGDLFVQLAVVPDPGFTAPFLSLPPGRRFIIR